jgi:adenosine deaminase
MREVENRTLMANQHLHLTGALSVEYLLESARQEDIPLSQKGLRPQHFDEPEIWALAKHVTSTPEGLKEAVGHVVDSQARDGVGLIELTFNPYGMLRRGMSIDEIAESVALSAMSANEKGVKLVVRPGVNRKDGPETVNSVRSVYEAIPGSLTLGIDLNGDERTYPTEPFVESFRYLAEAGIPTSIHAGEFVDQVGSLRSALRAHPQRVGHAVAVMAERELLDELEKDGVTVEVALTSNLVRGAVNSIKEHPVRSFVERGIPVVFGTDDPTFFNNTMADEFWLLKKAGVGRTASGELFLEDRP